MNLKSKKIDTIFVMVLFADIQNIIANTQLNV